MCNIYLILMFIGCVTSSADSPSVIIIDAGPSGIAAASKLLENNYTNIITLEAEGRIGGRINTGGRNMNGKSWLLNVQGFYAVPKNPNVLIVWYIGEFVPDVELSLDEQ